MPPSLFLVPLSCLLVSPIVWCQGWQIGAKAIVCIHRHRFWKRRSLRTYLAKKISQEQPSDEWYCPHCHKSPCLFLQWEEELDWHVDIMYPEVSNVAKWFHMYHHMSHQLHGPLKKGDRWKLRGCFETGLKAMFPSDPYVGFKPSPFQSGLHGYCDN
jgi:hypothetical protein